VRLEHHGAEIRAIADETEHPGHGFFLDENAAASSILPPFGEDALGAQRVSFSSR
jgi:hypothetical protein